MNRRRLRNRRAAETFEFEVFGQHYTCTIGRFDDGSLAEIFLGNAKVASASDTNARDASIVCSLALQHGTPVETIRSALCRDSQGRASGPLAAALDLIADHNG